MTPDYEKMWNTLVSEMKKIESSDESSAIMARAFLEIMGKIEQQNKN